MKCLRWSLALIAGFLLALSLAAASARAAEPAKPESATAQAHDEAKAAEHGESKEDAGEGDSHDSLKKSAAVRWIAKQTGLSVEWAYWLCLILNFLVVAGAIFWFSRKNLPGMFRDRTAAIQKSIEEARAASAEAQRRLSDIEARLGRLDAEITVLRVNADAEAKAEEARIREATEEERQRIVKASEQEIASAAASARRELKALAADLAISLAEKKIRVDAAADEAMVREFVGQLRPEGK
jgi:F-type H+-transporting ATPase subunit b